ncbi:MAG: heparan-alpha-glucosaminide N-acetyltransferase domain-containing protein [Ornithinimicrobium sp.]|uniref:heparan-alpha-glucosaminide N-acetyltransferase domain-containing protein n=1 Tax=Ornithinimicrobium sp. TaxID=1977084 RepID=UPI003D9B1575
MTATTTPVQVPAVTAKRRRITSLDWARGAMVLTNLVVIAYLYPAWEQLSHAQWLGVTVFDLVFPTFVSLSGCGLAFAYARRVDPLVTARRVVVLFGVGLVYNAVVTRTWNPLELRLAGPLQVYAVLVLVVALLHLVVHGVRVWAGVTIGLAAVWTAVSWAYNTQCPTGQPTRSCNLSAAIDLRLIPAEHLYRQGTLGHDPEGLAAIVGALITLLVGVTAGRILLERTSTRVTFSRLVAWLVCVAMLGALAAQVVAPFKRVWTPSFALLTATIGLTMLIVGYALHDRPAPPWWERRREALAQPLVALGRNALVLYFGSHLVVHELYVVGDPVLAAQVRDLPLVGDARMLFAVLFVLGFVALAWVLHRRRIYIHA